MQTIQWFDDSPDPNTPECICSLCGQPITDPVPIRMFDVDGSNQEARFDSQCAELVVRPPRLPPYYTKYNPPHHTPHNWQKESTGKLRKAIFAFIAHMTGEGPPPAPEKLAMTIQYCTHFIWAPCWNDKDFAKQLLQLRYEIGFVQTVAQLDTWFHKALDIGLDPF